MTTFVGAGDWFEKTVAGGSSVNLDLPAGAAAGDLCIAYYSVNAATAFGTQTGFTTIFDRASNADTQAPSGYVGRKSLSSTDITNGFVTLGSVPTAVGGGGALVFNGITTTSDFTAIFLDKTATTATFDFGTVAVSQADVAVCYFVSQATNGTNNFGVPSGSSPSWTEDGDRVSGRAIAMGHRIFPAASTGGISLNSTGTVRGIGFLVGFRSSSLSVTGSDTSGVTVTDASAITAGITGSDSGALTITEGTSAITAGVTGSDSGALTITDASSIVATDDVVPITGSDSSSFSIAESYELLASFSAADSGALAGADASDTMGAQIDTTDTWAFIVTEGSDLTAAFSSSDTGALAVTESSTVDVVGLNVSGSDSGAFVITETSEVTVFISGSDSGSLAVTDATYSTTVGVESVDEAALTITDAFSDLTAIVAGSDTGSLVVTDASAATLVTVTGTDSGALAVTDATDSTLVTLAATDTGTLIVIESYDLTVGVQANDSAGLSGADASVAEVTYDLPGADTGAFAITEGATDIQVFGMLTKSGSDTGSFAIAETSSVVVMVIGSDSGALTVTDSGNVSLVSVTGSDTGGLRSTESYALLASLSSSDGLGIASTESSATGQSITAVDTGAFTLTDESGGIVISGQVNKAASDTLSLGIVEDAAVKVFLSSGDFAGLTATDASEKEIDEAIPKSGAETGALSIVEFSVIRMPGSRLKMWTGTEWLQVPYRVLHNGYVYNSPPVRRWNGVSWS